MKRDDTVLEDNKYLSTNGFMHIVRFTTSLICFPLTHANRSQTVPRLGAIE